MGKVNEKQIYLTMGIGCGMIISGIAMVIMGLQSGQELTKLKQEYENKIKEVETQLTVYEKYLVKEDSQENIQEEIKNTQEDLEFAWVNIPSNYGANQIAMLLEESGVVEDSEKFSNFLIREQMTRKLRTGPKFLPLKGDYKEILAILLGEND